MKSKLFILTCSFFSLFSSLSANNPIDGWPTFKCGFLYYAGLPDERHVCVGAGTCRIAWDCEFHWERPAGTNQIDQVEITRDDAGNVIVNIPKSSLSRIQTNELFGLASKKFGLGNDSQLPESIRIGLGLPKDHVIKAGLYRFTESSTFYSVTF